jgi:hypothetical protein
MDAPNDDTQGWNQKTSPWNAHTNGDGLGCFWPLDADDTRICTLGWEYGQGGNHHCSVTHNRTCGSNYDSFGNMRFSSRTGNETEDKIMLLSGNYVGDLNWGFTTFDNLLIASLTIFQSVTEEGWVDVMYQIQDGFNGVAGAAYFIGLLIFGSFLLLNLTLAVLEDALSAQKDIEEERLEAEEEARLEASQDNDGSGAGGESKTSTDNEGDGEYPMKPPNQGWRMPFYNLAVVWWFDLTIIVLIILNTVVLAADHHPMSTTAEATLEVINFVLTVLFTLEMIIKLIGLGLCQYLSDGFNIFDGIVVTASWLEIGLAPPRFITGLDEPGESALSALRTFRLFRVFKLARSWSDLRIILEKIVDTFRDVSNFAVLLVLFMYIFALVGMQFFANRFRFDDDGILVPLNAANHATAELPRAHFDTLGWSLVTIFQLLSGENWNTVMYDGIRAGGSPACFYFIVMVILGDFIILNLFLAILLTNFDGLDEAQKSEGERIEQEDADDENSEVKKGSCFGLCGGGKKKSTGTKVAPAEAKSKDPEAWNFARRDKMEYTMNYDAPPNTAAGIAENLNGGQEDGAGDGDAAGSVSPMKVAPAEQSLTLHNMRLAQNFTQRLQKNRRGSLASPSVSRSMSMHTNDLIADIYLQMQGGTKVTLSLSQEPERGGITMTVGQLQNEIFKRTHVPAEDQALKWKNKDWDTSKRIVKNKRLCDIGIKDRDTIHMSDVFGDSLYLFPADSKCRLVFRNIVRNKLFDNFILFLILTSSMMLAAESPFWKPGSMVDNVFYYTDIGMTSLFTLEMVVKIIAYGFIFTRGAYLKNGWNVLDFVIVIVSIISLIARNGSAGLKSLRSLRTLRALRPLRMISRRPQLKLVVNSLFAAIPNVLNVLVVCTLFLLIFAIFCTNYFKGQFLFCDFESGPDTALSHVAMVPLPECIQHGNSSLANPWEANYSTVEGLTWARQELITYPTLYAGMNSSVKACVLVMQNGTQISFEGATSEALCTTLGYKWVRQVWQNFDNVAFSIGALFELSTTEGWVDVMYAAVDSRGIGMQPVTNPNGNAWAAFWVFYIVFGSFFIMNLFVGVVIEAFNNQKAEKEGDSLEKSLFADEDQKKWMKTQALLLKLDPKKILKPPPEDSWQHRFFNVVVHPKFEWFIMSCIIGNTIAMACKFWGQPYEVTVTVDIINYIFSAVFIVEMILKLMGFGLAYFKDAWNVFDFSIVWLTIIGYIVQTTSTVSVGPVAGAVRAFRIGRLIRLVRGAPKLRELINTLVLTLPALGNISAVLFLLYFIYAVMGVQLFAKVKYGDALNEQANFQTFGSAMMMLFRSATGENWNGVMYDLGNQDDCRAQDLISWDDKYCGFSSDPATCIPLDGCGNSAAFVYYVSFTLFVTFVFFNLFIAVILEASEISTEAEEESLSDEHLTQFMKQWVAYDPNDQRSITVTNLRLLLQELDTPMGFGKEYVASEKELTGLIKILQIPVYVNAQREPIVLFMDTGMFYLCVRRYFVNVDSFFPSAPTNTHQSFLTLFSPHPTILPSSSFFLSHSQPMLWQGTCIIVWQLKMGRD